MFQSEQFIILLQSIVDVIQQIICQKMTIQKKISDQQPQTLINLVENKVGVSQCCLGRRFDVSHSTLSSNFEKRISVCIHKRKSEPKYNAEAQQQRAESSCLHLYKKLSRLSMNFG